MKVLLITDNHSPHGGGAEKYFFTLKDELKKRKDIQVFSLGFGLKKSEGDDFLVLKETPSKAIRQFWRMLFHPLKYFEIRRHIKRINPDVIHLHNVKKYTVALLKAVEGYPVVQTVHDFSPICPTQWTLHYDFQVCPTGLTSKCLWQHRRNYSLPSYVSLLISFFRMRKLLKKSVQQFITPSPLLKKYLTIQGFNHVTYIPPFKKSTHFSELAHSQPNHFLYLGQLEKQKGVDILVNEFALACQQNKNLVLKIAGRGSEDTALKTKVRKLKLENNIQFIDWVNEPEKLYQESIAVIFPSVGLESFGLVITEAMGYGRAVIGSHRGPTAWLVEHDKTGLLFDPLKKGDLALCVLLLAANKTLAENYGKNGFKKLKQFPGNREIIDEILEIYSAAQLRRPAACQRDPGT